MVGLQATDVPVVHVALVHTVAPKAALTVASSTAKLRPNIVRTEPAVAALFDVMRLDEMTGVSYVTHKLAVLRAVPIIERTATPYGMLRPVPAGVKHLNEVADDHEAELQRVMAAKTVGVVSAEAKSRPEMVTLSSPEVGLFCLAETAYVKTGAS